MQFLRIDYCRASGAEFLAYSVLYVVMCAQWQMGWNTFVFSVILLILFICEETIKHPSIHSQIHPFPNMLEWSIFKHTFYSFNAKVGKGSLHCHFWIIRLLLKQLSASLQWSILLSQWHFIFAFQDNTGHLYRTMRSRFAR